MTAPQHIREWLIQMQYSNPYPSEEALQILCKGSVGSVFQQIIEKVKPRQDGEYIKKSILVNRFINDNTKICDETDILEINTYNEKRKLEKEFIDLNTRNLENEVNLQHLRSKLKSKNLKLQLLKQTIQEKEKDIVLFKVKSITLDKQIETCAKLLEQLNILQHNTCEKDLCQNFYLTLAEIEQVLLKFDKQLSPPSQDSLVPILEPFNTFLNTSIILSSNKKPLSKSKRLKCANSTRKNFLNASHNFSLVSSLSTIQKKNLSGISVHSLNHTTLTSNTSNESTKSTIKYIESLKDIAHNSWINLAIQQHVGDMWHFGPESVLKLLMDFKISHKQKIIDMIAENTINAKEITPKLKANFTCGLENLYTRHIQTELKRMKCDQQQRKITEMLETNLDDSISDLIILQVTEFGLQNSILHLRQSISKMQQDFSDKSDQVTQILNEIKDTQYEINTVKSKLETNLCLLYVCIAWLKNMQEQVMKNIKEPHSYSDSELLLTNTVENDVQKFLSCPFQKNNIHDFDRWNKIYNNQQLLKIFQCPFLSPQSSIQLNLNQKQWLHHLKTMEQEEDKFNSIKIPFVSDNTDDFNHCFKKSLEKLKQSEDKCRETLTLLNNINLEAKYNLTAPLNDCVARKHTYDDKKLKEYVEMYDEYYKKI